MWQGRSIEDMNKIVAKVLEDVHKLYQERGRIAPRNSGLDRPNPLRIGVRGGGSETAGICKIPETPN